MLGGGVNVNDCNFLHSLALYTCAWQVAGWLEARVDILAPKRQQRRRRRRPSRFQTMEVSTPYDVELELMGCNPVCVAHVHCRILLMERARCLTHFIRHRDSLMINALLALEPKEGKSKLVTVRCPASGTTLLHEAIAAEDIALIKRLLRLGANIHQASYQGITPSQLASQCRNQSIALYIEYISAGIQLQHNVLCGIMRYVTQQHVNFRNPVTGDTALHLCLYSMPDLPDRDRERRVVLLIELGADLHITNHNLVRPIDCLPENCHNLKDATCLLRLSSKLKQLIAEASDRQLCNRGVLSFHRANYRTTYNVNEENSALCRRALGLAKLPEEGGTVHVVEEVTSTTV